MEESTRSIGIGDKAKYLARRHSAFRLMRKICQKILMYALKQRLAVLEKPLPSLH
jgi:hypothetical protein